MCALPAYGWENLIEIGVETTFGTAVAATRAFRPISNSLVSTDPVQGLSQVTGSPVALRHEAVIPREWKPVPEVRGTLELHVDQSDVPLLIMLAMGGRNAIEYVKSGPVDTTAYTHANAFPVVTAADMPSSLTIIEQNGQEDKTFAGCMINSLEIVADESDLIRARIDILGQTMTRGNVAAAASISTTPLLQLYESQMRLDTAGPGQTMTGADNKGNVQSWSLMVENNLRAIPSSGVGVRGIRRPIYDDYRRVAMTVKTDWESNTYQDLIYSLGDPNAYVTLEMLLTSGTLITGAAATFYNHIFRLPAARAISGPVSHGGGAGVIPEEITFEAASWTTPAEIFEYTVVNGQAADYIV